LPNLKLIWNICKFRKLKILVTGASGFIGSKLIKKLIGNNHSVTALVHKQNIKDSSIKIIKGDLTSSTFVIPDGQYDVVIHLAAATPLEKNKKTLKKINYNGTVNLFEQIKDKTKFFVYASGLGVFGDAKDKVVDENTEINPHTEYAKIRLDAQKFLEKSCKENSIAFTVVYLGEVYGDGGWFANHVVPRIKKGRLRIPNSGNYYRSLIHVDDVVSTIVTIAEKSIQNDSFVVTDSNSVLFSEFINYVADKIGAKHPGSVPNFIAKAVLGKDAVTLLTVSLKTSNKKLAKLIELKYPSYKEGIDSFLQK